MRIATLKDFSITQIKIDFFSDQRTEDTASVNIAVNARRSECSIRAHYRTKAIVSL